MSAAYRASDDVGVTMTPDGVYVARLPGGPLLVLEGVAAAIWTEATTGPAQGWVGRVARAFGEPEDHVAGDVERFVADLEARGIVEALDADPTGEFG